MDALRRMEDFPSALYTLGPRRTEPGRTQSVRRAEGASIKGLTVLERGRGLFYSFNMDEIDGR